MTRQVAMASAVAAGVVVGLTDCNYESFLAVMVHSGSGGSEAAVAGWVVTG